MAKPKVEIELSLDDVGGSARVELHLLRAKAAAYDAIEPQMEQLRSLAASGFVGAAGPDSALILAAISEILLLRQERTHPVYESDLNQASMTAFGVMWRTLGELLNDRSKGSHQARYEAFVAGLNVMLPSIIAHAQTVTLDEVRTFLVGLESGARERIAGLTSLIHIPDRGAAISAVEIERKAYASILETLNNFANGGAAPTLAPNANPAAKVH
ncbi:hypothetical protein [Acidiphilium angustum]|uniref:hypothetical protein n=1 Tax=Acidiphilium angustum TaxID=523 RepID=UPI000493C97A|nr:hypothetical protein [Acidiphilium angustum]